MGSDNNAKTDEQAAGEKKVITKKNAAAAAADDLGLLSPTFNGLPKHHFKTALQQAMDLSASKVTKLDMILTDPRFREDSYYVESLGVVGPVLVRWIKANNAYLLKAKSLAPLYRKLGKCLLCLSLLLSSSPLRKSTFRSQSTQSVNNESY